MSIETPVEEMSQGELADEVRDLRQQIAGMEARMDGMNKKLERLAMAAFDEPIEIIDAEQARPLRPRLLDLEADIHELKKGQETLVTGVGNSRDKPDDRAMLIRQTLLNKAKNKNDGQAAMTRDQVDSRLGGGLHRNTILDAMKRAADGTEASSPEREYTPINGSSGLQPVQSVTFRVSSGTEKQSLVTIDLEDSTPSELRQNLTTEEPSGRGEKQP